MTVESLNCPNCGAGVASDCTVCQFCKTRLKTMACPKCFGLMFVGAKFCDHCGAIAAPVEMNLDEKAGDCPRCRVPLEVNKIGETLLRSCTKCSGLWLEVVVFETICADRESQSAVLLFLDKRTLRGSEPLTKINYVPCPDCGELMNRNNFARASGVIVDICKQHGVWFDADELPAIIGFIQKGGMELARQREKNELEEERMRLREEQRKMGIQDETVRTDGMWDDNEQHGIRGFVKSLFE
jgi:Zn-finger nucleic acid-binding protein